MISRQSSNARGYGYSWRRSAVELLVGTEGRPGGCVSRGVLVPSALWCILQRFVSMPWSGIRRLSSVKSVSSSWRLDRMTSPIFPRRSICSRWATLALMLRRRLRYCLSCSILRRASMRFVQKRGCWIILSCAVRHAVGPNPVLFMSQWVSAGSAHRSELTLSCQSTRMASRSQSAWERHDGSPRY